MVSAPMRGAGAGGPGGVPRNLGATPGWMAAVLIDGVRAARGVVRMDGGLGEPEHRGHARALAGEDGGPLVARTGREDLGEPRAHVRPGRPVVLVGEAGVVREVEDAQQGGVELRLERADRDVPAVRAAVGPVERGGAVQEVRATTVGPEPAGEEAVDDAEHDRRAVRHRGVDDLALARLRDVDERRGDPEREEHPASAHVADQVQRHDGIPVRRADRAERSREADVVEVVSGLERERSLLSPTGHPAVDQSRIARQAGVRAEPEPLRDTRAEPLDQRVRGVDQPQGDLGPRLALEVDRDRAPTAVQHRLEALVTRLAGPVDADHLRAEVPQDHPAERSRADPAELQDAMARQWTEPVVIHGFHASHSLELGVPARRGAVGNDAAEALAVASDEPVEGVRYRPADDSVADE